MTDMAKQRKSPQIEDDELRKRRDAGKRMKALRAKAGLTQDFAARAAELPLVTLQKWEQGINAPSFADVRALADVYGQSIEAFAEESKAPIKAPDTSKITAVLVLEHPAAQLDQDLALALRTAVADVNREYRARRAKEKTSRLSVVRVQRTK